MISDRLHITDARMLQAMEHCIAGQARGIGSEGGWAVAVGARPARIALIRAGRRQFTIHQMAAAARLFNLNLNWLAGLESNIFRSQPTNAA